MKIAVVSTGRSRCTLLARYLHTVYEDLEFCGEFYTDATWTDRVDRVDLLSLTSELLSKENYIVKVMALNLYETYDPSVFKFEEYDQIHLVERHDFFEQCCSWKVARTEHIYHLRDDNPKTTEKEFDAIRQHRYKLNLDEFELYAKYVDVYLKMKRHIVDSNLEYTLHTYESTKEFDKKQDVLRDSNLDYSEIVGNYHLKEEVNTLFNAHFSYEDMRSELSSFKENLNEIKGLRSMQSFANKMAAKWNK
jgi:hypothetical protein